MTQQEFRQQLFHARVAAAEDGPAGAHDRHAVAAERRRVRRDDACGPPSSVQDSPGF